MIYFAKLNNTNKVIGVYPVNDISVPTELEGINFLTRLHNYEYWVETRKGGSFRKNYAGTGYTYDPTRDAFIPPQTFPSWTLNEDTCQWDSPVPYPTDDVDYAWDEETTTWKENI
jgi:hypothetical protein